jgi:glycosyltransferase involved in cell wall biosynthesis
MTADTVGGVWTYAMDLCRALRPAGTRVLLATMGAPASADQRAEAAEIANLELAESAYRLEWMDDPWEDLSAAATWLLDLERRFQPEVIHLNNFAHGALPWCAPVLMVAHSCVLSWWEAVKGESAPPAWSHYRASVRCGLAAADLVVAPTHAMLDAVVKHYGPPQRSRVIANSCSRARFAPAAKKPFIFSAGRFWDEAKNAPTLARAAGGLPWPTRFAGACAPCHEVASNVDFLGHCAPARMVELFAEASIFAHPARYEPFGLAALEAATSGCALVLGDLPSLREVWGDAAVFVDPENSLALHRTLLRLIDHPAERAHLAYQARHRARRFTTARMLDAYLDAYALIVASAGQRPSLTRSA